MGNKVSQEKLADFFSRVIMSTRVIACYYRMLNVFQAVLERNEIQFFAHSGTLLGCVRHRGMIPWDDDLDFMMEEVFEERLKSIIPELADAGIVLKEQTSDGLYQFRCASKTICPLDVYLQIDLFVGRRELVNDDIVLHYKSADFKKWFPKRHIKISDLYPLCEYEFGPLKVLGVRNYEPYFSASGFSLTEAIVARHMGFEKFIPEIELLKEEGVYPIKNPEMLHYRHEISARDVDIASDLPANIDASGTVLTYGTFDLFHVGHVRLLKRLRALGGRLVVGVSTDEFNAEKGKGAFFSYEERAEILRACEYVDEVFPEASWDQKSKDVVRYNADAVGMGSDWQGRFDDLKELCKVVYLDRTEEVSTTEIKQALSTLDPRELEGLESSLQLALNIVKKLGDSIGA